MHQGNTKRFGLQPVKPRLLWLAMLLSLTIACGEDDTCAESSVDMDADGSSTSQDDDDDEGVSGSQAGMMATDDDEDDGQDAPVTMDGDEAADTDEDGSQGTAETDSDETAGDATDAMPSAQAAAPQVETASGSLVGKREGETLAYLGIPYAEPPVGALRFAPPAPVAAWDGVREATSFGKRCAQLESTVLQNAASVDEDCLYLNVWTQDVAPEAPKPVMVWIHGGGNVNGSASEPLPFLGSGVFYSGKPLVEAHDVVVVTFNYRLGVFGFLHDNALGVRGNQGLWDQQQVLAWVHENIAAFGGDPGRVTIFGESAGSYDVCLHMASPATRGLFHRAISQSGGCTTLMRTASVAAELTQGLLAAVDCADEADPLACLREKPVQELLDAASGSPAGQSFGPIVDRDFMPAQPRTLFDEGEIAEVPYILGSNSDEGTLFVGGVDLTAEGAYRTTLEAMFGASAEDVMELYPLSDFADGKPSPADAAYARIMGDSRLVCSTFDSAVRAARAGRDVYMYNFDVPVDSPALAELNLGATHGAELVYVFGTSTMFTPGGKEVSEQMQAYWARFAALGDVMVDGASAWPAFSAEQPDRLNFAIDDIAVVEDFRAELCEYWQGRYDLAFLPAVAGGSRARAAEATEDE